MLRYHRERFRGGDAAAPGSPRHDQGLQQKEDCLHRLLDVWATGEAAASLGFEASRQADQFDPMEKEKESLFVSQGVKGPRAQMVALRKKEQESLEYLELESRPEGERDAARFAELDADILVRYSVADALCNVLIPACKLWNTGYGATMMREAVSLVGGYGITEDCPGFLGQKWMDAQLEATYEGPEAVQRRHLTATMTNPLFLAWFECRIGDLQQIAARKPGIGACALAAAMEMWLWTLRSLVEGTDADGAKLYHGKRQGVTFPLADALCWLLAAHQFLLDVLELERKGPESPTVAEGLDGLVSFYTDLSHVQAARAAGESGRLCAELVFGYNAHPYCGDACCKDAGDMDCLVDKEYEGFARLRLKLDGCLAGSRLAKDRAGQALVGVMIPEALDYPL